MDLTNDDVADILALLDSLPYDELDLQTPRFRLTLRRTPDGWTQNTQVLSAPNPLTASAADGAAGAGEVRSPAEAAAPGAQVTTTMFHRGGPDHDDVPSSWLGARPEGAGGERDGTEETDGVDVGRAEGETGLVAVRAPLPGTFYRAPRPGAAPFVEVGSRVDADTVIGIVETMKLMNSVHAGVAGEVAEFCVANAEFAERGATLLRIRADR